MKNDEEIESINLDLVADRQALTFVVLLSSYALKHALIDKEVHRVLILAYGLLPIFLRAHAGDEGAHKQLGAIQKLIYAERYGFQVTDFDLTERIKRQLTLLQKATLENLVVSLYDESINDGSGGKEHKKLKADLRAYEKWREGSCGPNTPGYRYGCDLPTEEYTSGWRKRKPGSGGTRPRKKE